MSSDEFNIESVLGRVAGRPDHPDFWRLSEILLAFDGANDEDARTMARRMAEGEYGDGRSVGYHAMNRTGAVLAETGLPPGIIKALMCIWVEGFFVGSEFRKRQQADVLKGLAFNSINEEGEDYEAHQTLEEALEMLRKYPNDTVQISVT